MTDEILQTDIDLARRFIDAGSGDAEIIDLLARRNIAPNRAASLVSELREGRAVQPDRVWRALAVEAESARANAPRPSSTQGSAIARSPVQIRVPWFRILIAGVVAVTIALAVLFGQQRNRHHPSKTTVQNTLSTTAAPHRLEAASLLLEVSDSSLKFQGQPVGAENAIEIFTATLGAPSRTNRVAALEKTVYVFDEYGILIYPAVAKNPNSIVIDFEGTGGTNSALKAFAGVVKIREDSFSKNTDPKTMPAIEQLNGPGKAAGSGIYNLKLKSLRVVLASLSRPDRLSLIEIDFEDSWGNPLH